MRANESRSLVGACETRVGCTSYLPKRKYSKAPCENDNDHFHLSLKSHSFPSECQRIQHLLFISNELFPLIWPGCSDSAPINQPLNHPAKTFESLAVVYNTHVFSIGPPTRCTGRLPQSQEQPEPTSEIMCTPSCGLSFT